EDLLCQPFHVFDRARICAKGAATARACGQTWYGWLLERRRVGHPRTLGHVRLSGMITAVDAHAGGEPGRVIVGGVLDVPGNSKVQSVTFRNVASFVVGLDKRLEVPQLGTLSVDVAYGGMFYVIADAVSLGLRLTPDEGREIVRIGELIKAAAREQLQVSHPE